MSKNWAEKYRPEKFIEIIGQDLAIGKIKNFINEFPAKKKAMIFYGPPGTGKTTLAHAKANKTNSE